MRYVWIDREDGAIIVRWQQGAQPTKFKSFTERAEAESFANQKAGKLGCVISTLDCTPAQLKELAARKVRQDAAALGIRTRSAGGQHPLHFDEILLALRNHSDEGRAIRQRWLDQYERVPA